MKNLFKNKKKLGLFIIMFILIIVICIIVALLFNKNVFDGNEKNKFENEYESLNNELTDDGKKYPKVNIVSDNKMKYVTSKEILDIFNNQGDAVIYFGNAECLYCRTAVQVLVDTAILTELEEIYYFDVEKEDYTSLLNILDEKFITEEKKIYSPLVLFVANGKIVSYNKGTVYVHDDPYEELADTQKAGLVQIYGYGIRDVLESINVKKSFVQE